MFSALDPEELELVAGISAERRLEEGVVLYELNEAGADMTVITSGEVEVNAATLDLLQAMGYGGDE